MKIGAQFYTLREQCKDLNSFSESLKKVADIGYENVQISGTCDFEPEWLKNELHKNGLKCVLTHTPQQKLLEDTLNAVRGHDVFDCRCVGLGYYKFDEEKTAEQYAAFKKEYTPVIDTAFENGKYFMYHHHDHEFIKLDGKPIIERIAEDFEPERLGFTLDTFWVQAAGGDPAQWAQKFSGRIPCVHLKDYSYGKKMAVLGEGNINFDRFFAAAEKAGTEYLLVEQDDCNGEDPFECLKRSYKYLKAMGF